MLYGEAVFKNFSPPGYNMALTNCESVGCEVGE